jgi:hypothetical protein
MDIYEITKLGSKLRCDMLKLVKDYESLTRLSVDSIRLLKGVEIGRRFKHTVDLELQCDITI